MPGPATSEQRDEKASTEEVNAAIETYARAVEHRLKPGLDAACKLRDKAFEELTEVEQMTKALDVLDDAAQENGRDKRLNELDEAGRSKPALETMVNIGEEFYMNAHVHCLDPVIVDIGLGLLVEMSREEARQFVQKRKVALENHAEKHTKRIAEIRAQLKGVMQYLSELEISTSGDEILKDHFVGEQDD